jgi:hypothetical protein
MVSAVPIIVVALFGAIIVGAIVWMLFFQDKMSLLDLIMKIVDIALLPFKLFIRLFIGDTPKKTPTPPAAPPAGPPPSTVITHQIAECPPCNVKCPDPIIDTSKKPIELEVNYLKDMLRFVGTICRRENAINAQYQELYPGFSVMSPHVQRISAEYNFLKNQMREDENKYTYFKNYFTKLTGIPSTSSAVHYDLIM